MQKTAFLVLGGARRNSIARLAQLGPSDPGAAVLSPDSLTAEPSTMKAPTPAPASRLQELVSGSLSSFVDRKPEQAAAESFYQARNYQPIWTAARRR